MSRGQPLVVLRFQLPSECAAQPGCTFAKRKRFGVVRVAELLLDECNAVALNPLVLCCQVIRPWRGQHGLQALAEMLALLESQAHPRIEFAELSIEARQQRLVILATQPDDVFKSIETRLPLDQSRLQVLE